MTACRFPTLFAALFGIIAGGIISFNLQLQGFQWIAQTKSFVSSITNTQKQCSNQLVVSNATSASVQEDMGITNQEMEISPHNGSTILDEVLRNKLDVKDARKNVILSLWEHSPYLEPTNATTINEGKRLTNATLNIFPRPPHLEDCEAKITQYIKWDSPRKKGSPPHWSNWKGLLSRLGPEHENHTAANDFLPPWVEGSDADNLPMTRRVQLDLWLHQHPENCSDPQLKFLFVDWETRRDLGLGAMITSMAGFFALALRENRILVTNYFRRADHESCVGSSRARWHCYFLPETSNQCRQRAIYLASQPQAQKQGNITKRGNYNGKDIWHGEAPQQWGTPWDLMQPTTEIDAKLLMDHRGKDRRWWRAQAVRYLMRFPTEYTCNLMNQARHQAFGNKAADLVLRYLPSEWPEEPQVTMEGEVEKFVWESHRPWVPRPLMSIHVRLGDKASEMKMVEFKGYMDLAYRVRVRFPEVENIWLSTEMQDVIDQSKTYKGWNFYFTNVTRQIGAKSMQSYETSLGTEFSTANAIVNFLMAADADFFIGALGSTWCIFIDGMRTTGGKEMAGYLSVNKDRFW